MTAPNIYKLLTKGKWERPTDKMAVYTEINPDERWGIRVTLLGKEARVEAIKGRDCSWYRAPKEISKEVYPPNLLERLKGITFEKKLIAEVREKRAYAKSQNEKPIYFK